MDDDKFMSLCRFVDECFKDASQNKSKCIQDLLNMEGMTGTMTRHLYNNLCSLKKENGEKVNYLEIGCYKGSSTVSALYGNMENLCVTAIDNWSEFNGPKDVFIHNMKHMFGDNKNIQILNEDSFNLKSKLAHAPYDIYLYDGDHSVESHKRAITDYWDSLADKCIIMIDDWCWEQVRIGTFMGFEQVNYKNVYKLEITEPSGGQGYWNGCCIFLIDK